MENALLLSNQDKVIQYFKNKLSTEPAWAIKGLMTIYANQTESEKAGADVRAKNGQGFTPTDANILTSFANYYNKYNSLTDAQMTVLYKKMPKYARQLMKVGISKGKIVKEDGYYEFK